MSQTTIYQNTGCNFSELESLFFFF